MIYHAKPGLSICLLVLAGLLLSACGSVQMGIGTLEPAASPPEQSPALTEDPTQPPESVWMTLGVALAYLEKNYPDYIETTALDWQVENLLSAGEKGLTGYQFSSGEWQIAIRYPQGAASAISYNIRFTNQGTGFRWLGSVDADGDVVEIQSEADVIQGAFNR